MSESHSKDFALFLGCTIPLRYPFIESASRKVLNALNIKIKDLPFGCCPDPNGSQSFHKDTWFLLAARNLCLAEEENLDILTLCNGCYETLKVVNFELQNNEELRIRINKLLAEMGKEYRGIIKVRHIIQVLHELRDTISKRVLRPLNNFRFAIHYGCHLLRPSGILRTDNSEHPIILHELVQVLDGTTVTYLKSGMCCGAGSYITDYNTSLEIIREKIVEVNKTGADAMVVACPTCFRQYESGQFLVRKDAGEYYGKNGKGIPIVYYTELLAFALDYNLSDEFKQHHIKLPFP
ncbi:MAG: CoB--CoM heterodisulfide reductase iron-sulfur subunit B family protein [Promethearchaeota archaeon]